MRHSAHLLFLSIACAACSPPAPAAPWDWATAAPLPDELTARAPGNNAFAFDLFAQVRGQKGNLALSPFRFAATDGVRLLELPYESGGLRMTVVLPDQQDGLDAVEARLSPETFDAWTSKLSRHSYVHIELTPFEIDPESSLRLDEPLKALGMPMAFDRNKADFSGITNPDRDLERPYLNGVFHKVRIKLDAKNPEGPTWEPASNVDTRISADPIMRFDAMRPYLFFLRDVRSGMILFMGRVRDPIAK